jgi:DNA uptake protein ComE-like DNA-binding protein
LRVSASSSAIVCSAAMMTPDSEALAATIRRLVTGTTWTLSTLTAARWHPCRPMSEGMPAIQRSRWPYISLIPIGFGAWAPIYAGAKARRLPWILLGIVWCAIAVAGWVHNSVGGHPGHDDLAGLLMIVGWVGAIATSFSIRPAYERQMASPLAAAAEAGAERLQDRAQARRIVRENPALAREIGIGRPDRSGAADAGLVDVNNASVTALLTLPGVGGDLATQIIEAREKVHGFSSVEDMGAALDLDGNLVDGLRDQAVFLPRLE